MPTVRGKVGLSPGDRAKGSRKILKRILSKVNCLECGICCSTPGERHDVLVFGHEPNKERLYMMAGMRSGDCIERRAFGSFMIKGGERCLFLESRGRDKRCAVYGFRPAICATFPFMVQQVTNSDRNGMEDTRVMVVLTSMCPPLAEAKAAGVSYVAYEDLITGPPAVAGGMAQRMPMLGESLLAVEACIVSGVLFSLSDFFRFSDVAGGPGKDMPVFPIL